MLILRNNLLWIVLLAGVLMGSCKKETRCDTPIGEVSCTLDLTLPMYYPLTAIGGYCNLYGGHKGISVIRVSLNEFAAYERTCPNDHEGQVDTVAGSGGMLLECPECGCQFSTYTDGSPMEGSQTSCSLYKYSTYYDGYTLSIMP